MKTLLLLFAVIPSCFKPVEPDKYHIIIGVGQSNPMGSMPLSAQDSNSLAFLWNDSGWESADGALNRYSNIGVPYGGSMINTFGKELAQQSLFQDYKIGLVVNCKGGSFIAQWDTSFMKHSIQRTKAALADNPRNKVTAILWHQGESDMFDAHAWMIGFKSVRYQVDSLLGYDIPILVGGLSTVHYYYRVLNDTMRQVELIHDCYYVSSDSLTTTDGTHFDSPSLLEFGLRYYAKYKEVY